MALVYGLYYVAAARAATTRCGCSGSMFVFFYLAFLLWQTYYAILTSRTLVLGHARRRPAEVPA